MQAYTPTSLFYVEGVFLILFVAVLIGFYLMKLKPTKVARTLSWLLVLGGVAIVERLCKNQPSGFRMLAITGYGLVAMKAVVAVEARLEGIEPLPMGRWLAFSIGWFGMKPQLFSTASGLFKNGAKELFWKGVVRFLIGSIFVALAALTWNHTDSKILSTILLLPGLSLILHFGIFNMSAALWRANGIDCRPLFRAPLLAENISDFWGRRWNLGFNEMTAMAVYHPLCRVGNRYVALVISFLFSGLLHEMAISLPVMAGFGLPFLYFLLHGLAMIIERQLAKRGKAIKGWQGRLWTIAWLVLPLSILFHPYFLKGVVWPIIGIR